jgi:MFS family permease
MTIETKQMEAVKEKPRRRWYAVIALSSASLVDSMEGFGYEILWPYMYPALGLGMSMLAPILSVGRFIGTVTTPIWGAIADRFSRKTILIVMTGIWGLWTGMMGFVQAFWQLMVVRVAASLGLSVLYPVAYSIISDLFTREERGKAIGMMGAFGFAGSMVSTVVLGTLAAADPQAWRYGFILMGILSFITGVMLIFVKEPPRGAMEPELADVVSQENQLKFDLKKVPVLLKIPSYWILMVDEIVDWIGFSTLTAWAFTWLDLQDLGPGVPVVMLLMFVGVILGHIIFGWLSDKLDNRYPKYGRIVLGHVGLVLSFLSILGFLIFGTMDIIYLLISGLLFGLSFSIKETGSRIPLVQNILLPELRATGRSLIEVIKGLILTGTISLSGWLLNRLGEDLQMMMLLMVPTTMFMAALIWILLYKYYPKDMADYREMLRAERQLILNRKED